MNAAETNDMEAERACVRSTFKNSQHCPFTWTFNPWCALPPVSEMVCPGLLDALSNQEVLLLPLSICDWLLADQVAAGLCFMLTLLLPVAFPRVPWCIVISSVSSTLPHLTSEARRVSCSLPVRTCVCKLHTYMYACLSIKSCFLSHQWCWKAANVIFDISLSYSVLNTKRAILLIWVPCGC